MIRSNLCRLHLVIGVATMAFGVFAQGSSDDWKIAGPFGGTATSIAVDPSDSKTILAGAMDSLLFRSSDAGANWSLLDFPKRHLSELTSILIDPDDSKHYLVGVISADGGGLFESKDAGQRWSVIKEVSNFGVRALAYAPSQHMRFVAGTAHGVMMSDNCGKTWERISDPQNFEMQSITAVAFDSKDPNVLYAGTSHLPWKTMDGGKTWSSIHTGMIDDSDVFSIYVDPENPTKVLASACSGIYASDTRGDLWRKLMGIPNTSRRTHVIRADPSNLAVIYAGTTTGLYKSSNRGATWKTLTNTQANSMAFDPSNSQILYMALEYEGIGKSENGGEHIAPVDHGFVDRVISGITQSGKSLVAIETQDGETTGVFRSIDSGESWTQVSPNRTLSGVHLKAITGVADQDRFLLGASNHQLYRSIDAGVNWKTLPIRLISTPAPDGSTQKGTDSSRSTRSTKGSKTVTRNRPVTRPIVTSREVSVSDVSGLYSMRAGEKNVLFAATDIGLLKSSDMADHWMLSAIPGTTAVTALYLSAGGSGNSMVARAADGLFISKDLGDHWTKLSFPIPVSDVNDVAISGGDVSNVLVATRVGLYVSSDSGEKWVTKPAGIPISTVSAVIFGPSEQTAFAVEYGRLYKTENAGLSWSEVPSSLPVTRIRQLWKCDLGSTRLYALTGNLGVIYRN